LLWRKQWKAIFTNDEKFDLKITISRTNKITYFHPISANLFTTGFYPAFFFPGTEGAADGV
jgi:hypothetical protein